MDKRPESRLVSWFNAGFRAAARLAIYGASCASLVCSTGSDASSGTNKPAPEPTENPSSHTFSTFRVKVDSLDVDDLQVHSVWAIRNLACAPISRPSGSLNVGQPNPSEEVIREAPGEYEVRVSEDRYLQDACLWTRGGTLFNFMRKGKIFSAYVMNIDGPTAIPVSHIRCQPAGRWSGNCFLPAYMNPTIASQPGLFNGLIEAVP